MPQYIQRLRVFVGQNRNRRTVRKWALQIAHVAVHANGERGLGEAGADGFGKIGARRAAGRAFLLPSGRTT